MKIEKVIYVLMIVNYVLFSCEADDVVSGSGNLITETRTVSVFNKVSSIGVFDINITQGNFQSVEIIADDNIIDYVTTKVVNNELLLYLDDSHNYSYLNLKANIVVEHLNAIKNEGIGKINIINVNESGSFSVYNSGTGDITMSGTADNLILENEGTGIFKGFQFMVINCNVDIIGSGDCEINALNSLDVVIEGSGDVYYKGTPSIQSNISGSGMVINAN